LPDRLPLPEITEPAPPAWSQALHAAACSSDAPATPDREPGRFVDVAAAAGVRGPSSDPCAEDVFECHATAMTGAVAAGDFDHDGFPDLYVSRVRGIDSLYLNCGDGRFADVTAAMGITKADAASNGAGFADVDGDGDLDLFVLTFGVHSSRHYLYLQEDGEFREDGVNRGIAMLDEGPLYGTSLAFADYDNDGYVDVYFGEWRQDVLVPKGQPTRNHARLYRNRGARQPGFFDDVTDRAGVAVGGTTNNGIATLTGVFVFTPIFSDLDADGLLDLALASDYGASRLFWNQGGGRFEDGTQAARVGTDRTGMGAFVADYDGDGLLDWFVTAIYEKGRGYDGNRLYRNLGQRTFVDATDAAGVRDSGWAWGTSFVDYDNDGDGDAVVAAGFTNHEGFVREYPGLLALFRHPGREAVAGGETSRDVSEQIIPAPRGQGRGVAVLDYDRDGDEDLFVVYFGGPDALLRNDVADEQSGWLRVRLQGRTNRDAIGARVWIRDARGDQLRELHAGSGYLSQHENVAHFGLGQPRSVDLDVRWPGSGRLQRFTDVSSNRSVLLLEPPP